MLLRNSISSTKKFFQKTFQNFRSFFSGTHYQKLHKTPPHNNINAQTGFNNMELDKFYTDFADRWNSDKERARGRSNQKKTVSLPPPNHKRDDQIQRREDYCANKHHENKVFKSSTNEIHEGKLKKPPPPSSSFVEDNSMSTNSNKVSVAEKLKELEMMDISNVDHALDIEEVLHYYSRLTCPAYVDIVDKFFMDMYSEFLGAPRPPVSPRSVNSRPRRRRSVRI